MREATAEKDTLRAASTANSDQISVSTIHIYLLYIIATGSGSGSGVRSSPLKLQSEVAAVRNRTQDLEAAAAKLSEVRGGPLLSRTQ